MGFNEYGYLEPGFHDLDINEIKNRFVLNFNNSSTRKDILNDYIEFIDTLEQCGIERAECWIDGSFATQKENPNDIDMVLIINKDILDNVPEDKKSILYELFTPQLAKIKYRCDAYVLAKVDEGHSDYNDYFSNRSYWRGLFCFDRKENPKGIIRTNLAKEVGEI